MDRFKNQSNCDNSSNVSYVVRARPNHGLIYVMYTKIMQCHDKSH